MALTFPAESGFTYKIPILKLQHANQAKGYFSFHKATQRQKHMKWPNHCGSKMLIITNI